jgi:MFS family permease
MSFTWLSFGIGIVIGGWLSDRLQRRKPLLIVAGFVMIPVYWLVGQATSVWQLAVFSATTWFLGAIGYVLIQILAGLSAEENERGKVFGILALNVPLSQLIGGLTAGPIADRWGYPTLFTGLAMLSILWPSIGLLLEDKRVARVQREGALTTEQRPGLGPSFYLLLVASMSALAAFYVGSLGRSLAMDELGLTAAAISSTSAVAGAVTLPLSPLLGWLSDRVGRKRLLTIGYLTGGFGLLVLSGAVSLWHFWLAVALMTVLFNVNNGVGSALVTDLVPQASLGRGMSLFTTMMPVAGIIGSTGTGHSLQQLGETTTFILGAFLPLLATLLLIPIREARREEASVKVALA